MKNFLKQTFSSILGTLIGLTIFSGVSTIGLLSILIVATASKDTGPEIKDNSILVFDLGLKITDSTPSSSQFLQKTLAGVDEDQISLHKLVQTLEKAQHDPHIVGIYLDGTHSNPSSEIGFASLKEIRQALEKFRASGKKIIAYGTDWSKREYYLSSVANNIVLNPVGMMEVNGLGSQPMFLSGALQKYGIGVQVVRVGKFKGAVEPYILNKLSPENRLQIQKLLDDVWGEWLQTVGASRKLPPQKLQAIADNQAFLTADFAKSSGLVDQVAYLDEVVADLRKLTNSGKEEKTFRKINLSDYAQVPGKDLPGEQKSAHKVAIVYAEGEIVDGKGDDNEVGGDRFAKIFSKIRQDQDVKAVVLRINSPGGSATAAEVIQREIKLTRQSKPVIVSMGDVAASGGYWIASDSNRIFAQPNTITGSIGVFGLLFNGQKLGNNNGITWDTVKTANYADTQTAARPKSAPELAIYQRSVDKIYSMFLDKVAQGRKLTTQKVAEIAQGRVWSGTSAKNIGLVDEIGGLDTAIAYAVKQANLGDDWELQEYPRVSTFEERFLGRIVEDTRASLGIDKTQVTTSNPLTDELRKLQQEVEILGKMNDPHGVYARLPFSVKIN